MESSGSYIFLVMMKAQLISAAAVRNNYKFLEIFRSSMAIVTGISAGIMGLENQYGFLYYFGLSAVLSLVLLLKCHFDVKRYFVSYTVLLTGILGNLASFILFWTFGYAVFHVYE
jgi:hypothetical protein